MQAIYPDITQKTSYKNIISIRHTAGTVLVLLVSFAVQRMKEFYRVKLKTKQCNEFKTFQGKKVNSSLGFILKIFLKFLEFKSQNILLYIISKSMRAL